MRPCLASAAVLLVLLTACGGGDDTAERDDAASSTTAVPFTAPPPTSIAPPDTIAPPPTTTPPDTTNADPTAPDDVATGGEVGLAGASVVAPGARTIADLDGVSGERPDDVADLIDWVAGGGDGVPECPTTDTPELSVGYGYPQFETGYPAYVCASGFLPDQPIRLEVTNPDGDVVFASEQPTLLTYDNAVPFWFWRPVPDSVLGTHRLTVRQGATSSTTTVDVYAGTFRRTEAASPTEWYLFLYPPGAELRVFLFERAEPEPGGFASELRFVAELPPVTISDRGGAIYELTEPPDRPVCIRTEVDLAEGRRGCIDTNEMIFPPFGPPTLDYRELAVGDTGPWVEMLQRRLVAHGADIALDGTFGTATDDAVRAFQQTEGLRVDGVVGPATWTSLVDDPT